MTSMESIKNIICLALLMISANAFSQSKSIANDELYLKYEKAYVNYTSEVAPILHDLDNITRDFYNRMEGKTLENFYKSNDKVKWLNRNIKKTTFKDVNEALFLYDSIEQYKSFQDEKSKELNNLLDQLLSKYDRDTIYFTLKDRLLKE